MKRYTMWLEEVFVGSAAVLLLMTGGAKLFSITGSASILESQDPVLFFVTMRQALLLVAVLEVGVASLALLRGTAMRTKLFAIAWLGSLFGLYRLGLWMVGYEQPCKCLGGALDWLGLPDPIIRGISLAMFLYLWAGSCVLLLVNHLVIWKRLDPQRVEAR